MPAGIPFTSSPLALGRLILPHRIIRAATFENAADQCGNPTERHAELYSALALGNVGTIITGFTYVSPEGRAMHPFQAGMDRDQVIDPWQEVIARVKAADPEVKIIAQIAHTGRQTVSVRTGRPVVGAGPVRCSYFLSPVRTLREDEIPRRVRDFVAAAVRAERAGFDGIQVHAAHGYLIHQFLSPHTNRRQDCYGHDPFLFLRQILEGIREKTDIPILLKLSAAEDRPNGMQLPLAEEWLRKIESLGVVAAVEISYGTMEIALNIIRGGQPLDAVLAHNPLFTRWGFLFAVAFRHLLFSWYRKRFLPYRDMYNLNHAIRLRRAVKMPLLVTGGIRSGEQVAEILTTHGIDGVTLCRPFICEPDLVKRLRENPRYRSRCSSCNLCTVLCDSPRSLQCYLGREQAWRR